MSAREAENGFVGERFVSSQRARRNIWSEKENDFNEVKMRGFQARNSFVLLQEIAASALPRPACEERHRPPLAAVLKRTPKQGFGYVASQMQSG
jgi:hypothetical protein